MKSKGEFRPVLFSVDVHLIICRTWTPAVVNPTVFRQGQLVEATINIRALRAGTQRSVIIRMESLTLHDRYGAKASLPFYFYGK